MKLNKYKHAPNITFYILLGNSGNIEYWYYYFYTYLLWEWRCIPGALKSILQLAWKRNMESSSGMLRSGVSRSTLMLYVTDLTTWEAQGIRAIGWWWRWRCLIKRVMSKGHSIVVRVTMPCPLDERELGVKRGRTWGLRGCQSYHATQSDAIIPAVRSNVISIRICYLL